MDLLHIREAIVVEGRYDKNTLSQIVDAPIFQTNGFGIHKDKQLLSLLRRVAQIRGLIVLTDSDGAGFVIRNFLKSAIPASQLKHAYIPDVYGKERRKAAPGKEGKLGVEGMHPEVLLRALQNAGATIEDHASSVSSQITKQDLVELGLSGGANSSRKRLVLLKSLQLPEHMSSNAMLQALNLLMSLPQLSQAVAALELEND